jgi:hypothetical protein
MNERGTVTVKERGGMTTICKQQSTTNKKDTIDRGGMTTCQGNNKHLALWRQLATPDTQTPNRLVKHNSNSILIYICDLLKDNFLQLSDNNEGKKKEV